jgi:hypothetical protein
MLTNRMFEPGGEKGMQGLKVRKKTVPVTIQIASWSGVTRRVGGTSHVDFKTRP